MNKTYKLVREEKKIREHMIECNRFKFRTFPKTQ